jgi:hypothetical protein
MVIGDRVIIRRPRTEEERDEFPSWTYLMDIYDGKEAVINGTFITEEGIVAGYTSISGSYQFNSKWLELIHESSKTKELTW